MSRPKPPDVPLLLEDEWLLAVDKPSGLATHGGGGLDVSLTDWIAKHLGPKGERNGFRVSPAHRLDRETSGVILIAKRRPAMARLMAQFEAGLVHKRYLALVRGAPPDEGVIDRPLESQDGRKQAAVTRFTVRERREGFALVECRPETGRRHQLRLHFQLYGHPIVGDAQYGDEALNTRAKATLGLTRLFLHAESIAFAHPRDDAPLTITAPLAGDLEQVIARLRGA